MSEGGREGGREGGSGRWREREGEKNKRGEVRKRVCRDLPVLHQQSGKHHR